MKLIIDKNVRAQYPDLRIGIVVASNVNNSSYSEQLDLYIKKKFRAFAEQYKEPSELLSHKNIKCWQETYRSFGINPKKKKPTAESLLYRTVKSGFIPHINAAVDSYLVAETLFCLPIGGYDLDKISGDITLRISDGGERFLGVGSDSEEITDVGEVIYSDYARVLTRRWNYRDAEYTKIQEISSKKIALFTEAPNKDITDDEIAGTVLEIVNNLKRFCDANVNAFILTKSQNEIVLD